MILSTLLSLTFACQAAAPEAVAADAEQFTVLRAAKVYTADEAGMINNGLVVIQDGKIVWVGEAKGVEVAEGVEVQDLGNVWLVPGLIEPHNHVAGSLRDLNDTVFLTNPELHTYEVLEPQNPYLLDGIAGGITSALFIPGSGSNMGGFGMLVKTSGKTPDEMVVRSPGSLKVAQSGNPERYSWGVRRAMMNWNTRNTLKEGLAWAAAYEAGEADFNPRYEDFIGLRNGTVPVSVHTQIYQVVLETLTMQVQELGLKSFIDHGTFDGYKNAALAAELGVPVMNGPRQFWFDRSTSKIMGCAAGWASAEGIILGYNTDSPVIPQEQLPFQAAMGVRLGAGDAESALKGMTANAAKALLMEDIAGRLVEGLDADLVAWTGDPVDPRSSVLKVWVRGEKVYDVEEDKRRF
ncbi:MAG: amidohydrolase family protein [Planctomycetota bacterium]|jgi:imidazolonepropionase-like amidohydrolase